MLQKYTFSGDRTIVFDDTKSVKALIAYAFEMFDYYEPLGMEIVTVFQYHHPNTNTGWFTTDITKSCAEEIKRPDTLCFAYHMPNTFYFAEGGWGHHMPGLGNRPPIDNEVSLKLRFDDFRNTVIINGKYTFRDIINLLKRTGYIKDCCSFIRVLPIGCAGKDYAISFDDPIMNICLSDFEKKLEQYNSERIHLNADEFIYHTELEFC